jgi:hypothetical protein
MMPKTRRWEIKYVPQARRRRGPWHMLGEYCQQRMGCSSAGSSVCNKHGKFSLESHEIVHESHCWVSFVSFRNCSLVYESSECILDRTNLTSNSSADKLHCVAHHLCGCSYLQSFAIWSLKVSSFSYIYLSLTSSSKSQTFFNIFCHQWQQPIVTSSWGKGLV